MLSLFLSQNDKSENEQVNCRGFGREAKLGQWDGSQMVPSRFDYVVHLVVKSIDQSGSSKGSKIFP